MAGRQSTGPLPQKKAKKKTKAKQRGLNAFAIAQKQHPDQVKIRKHRLGEQEPGSSKRKRDGSEDGSEEDREENKKPRRFKIGDRDHLGNEIEGGSDSEGNNWITGAVNSDDDSDLDSNIAMAESDDEKFAGFQFRGSSSTKPRKRRTVTPKALGADEDQSAAIDLKEDSDDKDNLADESDEYEEQAVDMFDALGSELASEASDSESAEDEDSVLSVSDIEDDPDLAVKLSALKTFGPSTSDSTKSKTTDEFNAAQEAIAPSDFGLNPRRKITIEDLLPTITDPRLRKSLKMMVADGKTPKKGSGIPSKLNVPLAKRQQDRLDRAVAYDKTKETLNKWTDTIKHNRRAEHISFPLPNPDAESARNNATLYPTTESKPLTSLESTIQGILIESGLAPANGRSQEAQIQAFEELATNKMPIEEVQARRAELRKARELLFREEIRAKRIKKIKSKSYRRVHRRERERNLAQNNEALTLAGAELDEDEAELNDRRRAEERMGARHRDSKWARGIKETKRAAWDEDARNGVTEMARREEELRRRMAGKDIQDNSSLGSDSESSEAEDLSGDEGDREVTNRLFQKLESLRSNRDGNGSGGGLANMKFMRKAEEARKEQNEADIARLRRELAGEDSPEESDFAEAPGRRTYGPEKDKLSSLPNKQFQERSEFEEDLGSDTENAEKIIQNGDDDVEIILDTQRYSKPVKALLPKSGLEKRKFGKKALSSQQPIDTAPVENPWLTIPNKKKYHQSTETDSVLISANLDLPPAPIPALIAQLSTSAAGKSNPKPKPRIVQNPTVAVAAASAASRIATSRSPSPASPASRTPSRSPSPPPILSNRELIHQAFAGDNVLAAFNADKAATAADEDVPTTDNSLPGWGSWVGTGLSTRERKRGADARAKAVTRSAEGGGVAPERRRDARLERVVVNERRIKKVRFSQSLLLPFIGVGGPRTTGFQPGSRTGTETLTRSPPTRMPSTCPRRSRTLSRRAPSTSGRCACPLGRSGRPRRRSRLRRSRGC
jgi:U3 small nucleolar RNA-associated protein 14